VAALDHYLTLGSSGLKVSQFCLGAMTFGEEWGFGSDAATAGEILDYFLSRGGNFIDTANIYTRGSSERIIGSYMASRPGIRNGLVIATKFSGGMHPRDPNAGGASRKAIVRACEESLQRLATEWIDLYWMHWHDRYTPIEETMRALDDLVSQGKVRYLGFSDTPAWRVVQAQLCAQFRGWSPLIALQIEYSLLERTVEGELLPMARELGLGVTPWGPLRAGVLSGKYSRARPKAESPGRQMSVESNMNEHTFELLDVLGRVAAKHGRGSSQVALAWLRTRPGVTSPILGARKLDQLMDNLGSLTLELDSEDLSALDSASTPRLNFPAEFLERAAAASYGGMSVEGRSYEVNPMMAAGDGGRK
jgi:aryl-alcohol dehydrogenase-like predicted oxidoreductase